MSTYPSSPSALVRSLLLLSVILLVPASAAAWGDEGHHVVAMIAARHLSHTAEQEINEILKHGLCSNAGSVSDKLVCVATWADGSRFTTHTQTYNWHFVDITLQHRSYDPAHDCDPQPGEQAKGMCGLVGLEHSLKILRKEETDPKITRAQALMFVVHIVGDLHQPLHTVLEDIGGNFHTVKYFGTWSKMHKVWDTKIILTRMMKLGKDESQFAGWLDAALVSDGLATFQQGNQVSWLNDAHGNAIDDSYGWQFKDGTAQSGTKKYPWLRSNYYTHNVDVVELQLKRAGARLAKVLNDAIG